MREIKFRAWDKVNGKMIGPFSLGSELSMAWPPEMQYTGLKDCRGKEIYEGDIIKISNWSTEIHCPKCGYKKINAGFAKISFSNLSVSDYGVSSIATFTKIIDGEEYPLDKTKTDEVIGNVYENPELLK